MVVEKWWNDLSAMMTEAKVPDLEDADRFLLATIPNALHYTYPTWLHDEQRSSRVDWNSYAWLMAKL